MEDLRKFAKEKKIYGEAYLRIENSKEFIQQYAEYYAEQKTKELQDKVKKINKYGRHQFNRGNMKLDLIPFEVWVQPKETK